MLEKICTSLEVSKKLKELRIKIKTKSFFYWWFDDFTGKYELTSQHKYIHPNNLKDTVRAYILEQILEILPVEIPFEGCHPMTLSIFRDKKGTTLDYADCYVVYKDKNENLATTAARLLIELKEDKII